MNDFLPEGTSPIKWAIPIIQNINIGETRKNGSTPDEGKVFLSLRKRPLGGKSPMKNSTIAELSDDTDCGWTVDLGKIEAILSLWIASIEAQDPRESENDQNHEWRRSQATIGPRINYRRFIGNSYEDVLLRDLSWWVTNQTVERLTLTNVVPKEADLAEGISLYNEDKYTPKDVGLVIGFTGPPQGLEYSLVSLMRSLFDKAWVGSER